MTADPFAVARLVTDVLDRLTIPYSIGGSMASSFAGEPRSTLDVDVVAAVEGAQVAPLVAALAGAFYVEQEAVARAVRVRGAVNLIHLDTSIKVDLFVAGGTPLDDALLARRTAVTLMDPAGVVFVHSPEDILLQKLRWYRRGGEVSERQWRDVVGIVQVQGARLDLSYLRGGAETLGVADLLERVLDES